MANPLEGYRVLDVTTWFQSLATRMLADLGAEVIKIEPQHSGGDPVRGVVSQAELQTGKKQRNVAFEHGNCNKKSITLDLRKPKGREVLYKLVEKSDVFVHNLRSEPATRLGLDYATVSQHNPRLIYSECSAWGPKGPGADRAAYDRMAMARSGIMTIAGEPGAPPSYINGAIADHTGANMAAFGIVLGLLMREKFGIGQQVESSLLGSMVHLMSLNVETKVITNNEIARYARAKAPNPMWNEYRCQDDKWISLGMLQSDRYWHSFCQALEIGDVGENPRFANIRERAKNNVVLIKILDEVFASRPRHEWIDRMDARGDLIFEPVNSFADLVEDPQVMANNYITEYEHPTYGKTRMVGCPIHFNANSTSVIKLPPPQLGEHTEQVLQEILGYSWDDIIHLKDEGVI
ncbi:MAG: CoA transferase [Dehalococcoidia bacterium]|nr:CoA transferase [Dehalococcoidia bacterium]